MPADPIASASSHPNTWKITPLTPYKHFQSLDNVETSFCCSSHLETSLE